MSDDAGNRSALAVVGRVDFPGDATPTPTATPTSTATMTPTVTPTRTVPPIDTVPPTREPTLEPTLAPTGPPPTAAFGPEDDSCNITAQSDVRAPWWMMLPIGVIAALRRRLS
jgi:hypothetical protein